jgi:hypothetical protein
MNEKTLKAILLTLLSENGEKSPSVVVEGQPPHPMLGRRCLIRTYSAGVHIGDIESINGMEVHLKNSIRLWSWKDGGLSLSAVANDGIKSGRLNKTGEVYLTNAIEIIPTTPEAVKTYVKFIED